MVQKGSTSDTSAKDEDMPMYMQSIPSGYRFRRIVPPPLRSVIGRSAIIVSLGKDFTQACRRAREEAVRSDQLFDEARARLAVHQAGRFAHYERLTPITELTEELKQQLQAYWLSVVDAADQERRAAPRTEDSAQEREEFRREAQSMLATLKAAWRDGNVDPLLPALHTTLMIRGYRLELPLEDERRLCLQFLRAALAGYKLLEARDEGEDPPLNLPAQVLPPGTPAGTDTVPPAKGQKGAGQQAPTLYSLFEYWRDGVARRTPKTVDDVERRVREFETLIPGKTADQLVKADFIAYRDARIKKGLALSTVEKDLSFLKTVMQFAFDSEKLVSNPAAGVKIPKATLPAARRDLDSTDLQRLFASPIYAEGARPQGGAGEAAAWLPLMALYTGARLEELCQLTLEDIRTDAAIPHIRILDLVDEKQEKQVKRLKNEGSRREIPIPAKLVAHGFLRYVQYLRERRETWLFPDLAPDAQYGRRGANWSKWWGRWRVTVRVAGRDKCFHAFRHVFKTACRAAGVGEDLHDAITGHSTAHEGRRYGKFPLAALRPAIDKVAYPEFRCTWVWTPPEQPFEQRVRRALAAQAAPRRAAAKMPPTTRTASPAKTSSSTPKAPGTRRR